MSMCRAFSCVVGRGCLLWPVHFLGKSLLVFAMLHSAFQGRICLLLHVFLDFLLLHSSPLYWKGHLLGVFTFAQWILMIYTLELSLKISLIIFFAPKDGEALYSQQKQEQELTMAKIMDSLLPNSDSNWRKQGKLIDHSGLTSIKSLMNIQWKWEIDLRSISALSLDKSAWWTMKWGSWHCTGDRNQDHPYGKEMQET